MLILFEILLFVTAVFLILLVLVQRGKGGGLAGALGGMGGQSAFGTKAGDLFTKITIGVAAFWIVLCATVVWYLTHNRHAMSTKFGHAAGPEVTSPLTPGQPASNAPASNSSTATPAVPAAKGPAAPAGTPAASNPAPTANPAGGKK